VGIPPQRVGLLDAREERILAYGKFKELSTG